MVGLAARECWGDKRRAKMKKNDDDDDGEEEKWMKCLGGQASI